MNCWSITTTELVRPPITRPTCENTEKYDPHQCWVICELKRNDMVMLRRVVPVDIVAEVIPAMHMVGQGMAVLEINPRLTKPIDLPEERINTLLEVMAEKFGRAPTVEFICKTVDAILERGGICPPKPLNHTNIHLVGDQHSDLGEDQQSEQPAQAVPDTVQNARTDPHTEGVEPRGGKTCDPD